MLQVLRGYPRLFQCVTARVPPSTTCFLPRTKVQQRKSLGIFSTNLAGNESEHVSLNSQIEWTDATWNPVRGCTKISPGCKHCYAETFAERFRGVKGHPYERGFDLRLVPEKLAEPLRWRAPKMIFVNSMSDLFHDEVPDNYIAAVAQVMGGAKWHNHQVLSKRSGRLPDLLHTKLRFAALQQDNSWGVSVGDTKDGV